jgi:hypothetical protein
MKRCGLISLASSGLLRIQQWAIIGFDTMWGIYLMASNSRLVSGVGHFARPKLNTFESKHSVPALQPAGIDSPGSILGSETFCCSSHLPY